MLAAIDDAVSPANKLRAMIDAAQHFHAGTVSVIARDRDEKAIAVGVYAEGKDAIALDRWLKRRRID